MNRGDILLAQLNPVIGHEQARMRPCIVLMNAAALQHQRYPLLVVAPLTTTSLTGPLYPPLEATAVSRLRERSWVLVDHLRSIDKTRIAKRYGRASDEELLKIDEALRFLVGL
jgi:mRNA interferase MazF